MPGCAPVRRNTIWGTGVPGIGLGSITSSPAPAGQNSGWGSPVKGPSGSVPVAAPMHFLPATLPLAPFPTAVKYSTQLPADTSRTDGEPTLVTAPVSTQAPGLASTWFPSCRVQVARSVDWKY